MVLKALLVWPNSRNEVLGWGDLGAIAEPLALEYLGAGLQADGVEVQILDLRLHPGALGVKLLEFRPDIVGVTAFSMHVRKAIAICRETKAALPGCMTVAGGHHATFLPDDFRVDGVDAVVVGEGVRPLREIARRAADGRGLDGIPGVWARVGGAFAFGGDQPELKLDELPMPDRTLTSVDRASYFIDWMKPVALLRSTAGCPFRCTFCSVWKATDGKYLMRDFERVIEEIRAIPEDYVFLVDDEAFIHGKRMLAFAQALKAAGIRKRFMCYCRVDSILRETESLEAWREVGLERLFVGIDAISKKNLLEYNKRSSIQQIEQGLAEAKRLGFSLFCQFVVNTDYTERDFQQLVRFIEHHKLEYVSFTVLTPLPGTDMLATFDHVIERQPNGRPNWDLFDTQNAVTRTRLDKASFRKEYRGLYRVFQGHYAQYREHNQFSDKPAQEKVVQG